MPGSYTRPVLLERCPNVLWRHGAGRLVLLDARDPDAEPLTMSGLGMLTWLLLDRPTAFDELHASLIDVLDPTDRPEPAELRVALDDLIDRGLLRPIP